MVVRWGSSKFLYRSVSWMRDLKASSNIPTRLLVKIKIPGARGQHELKTL